MNETNKKIFLKTRYYWIIFFVCFLTLIILKEPPLRLILKVMYAMVWWCLFEMARKINPASQSLTELFGKYPQYEIIYECARMIGMAIVFNAPA